MKILHIIPNLGVGGTEKMLLELCRNSTKTHSVVSLKFGGPTMEALVQNNIQVTALGSPDGFLAGTLDLPRLYFGLKKIIRETSPDIVHTWLTRANTIGRLAARCFPGKVISSLRVIESEKKYHLWVERCTQKRADIVTVNCTPLKDFAVREIGIPEEKIRVIFNGIEIPPPLPDFAEKRPGQTVILGTMGRLHKQKGLDIFLRAVKIVAQEYAHCLFHIAGDGPEHEALKNLAQELGVQDKVIFLGIEKSPEFFKNIDIFVLASRWEGMPNVILEAMAYKKGIVSTNVGGVTDLLEDQIHGLLVPPENPEALARAMLTAIKDIDIRQKMEVAAYQRAAEEFSLKKMVETYDKLYETISES